MIETCDFMSKFKKIRKLMKKEKPAKPKKEAEILKYESEERLDKEALSKIVGRLREKYIKEGILEEERIPSRTIALKKAMAGKGKVKIRGASPRELALFENPLVRFVGKFYVLLEKPISFLTKIISKRIGRSLELDLLASGMAYSVEQYLSLSISATLFSWLVLVALLVLLITTGFMDILVSLIMAIIIPILLLFVALRIPRSRAQKRGNEIDKQLPFALRHMSIEIRAGVGIFKTMESVSGAGYGPLSEDFAWILAQIEKGVPTEDALSGWAERTRSDAVKRVVSHLVRALKTGGNLSDIMITIAEDVSFERRMKIADFAEKLNLLGLFLMMVAIVFPVMITILTTISSSPAIKQYLGIFSIFTPQFLMVIYFVVCPSLIAIFIYFIKSADPGT